MIVRTLAHPKSRPKSQFGNTGGNNLQNSCGLKEQQKMQPVPNDLRRAFCQAVIELNDWSPSDPEPKVRWGDDHFPISSIPQSG
jgi:hypothetical protein